jgi:hypothetical protein
MMSMTESGAALPRLQVRLHVRYGPTEYIAANKIGYPTPEPDHHFVSINWSRFEACQPKKRIASGLMDLERNLQSDSDVHRLFAPDTLPSQDEIVPTDFIKIGDILYAELGCKKYVNTGGFYAECQPRSCLESTFADIKSYFSDAATAHEILSPFRQRVQIHIDQGSSSGTLDGYAASLINYLAKKHDTDVSPIPTEINSDYVLRNGMVISVNYDRDAGKLEVDAIGRPDQVMEGLSKFGITSTGRLEITNQEVPLEAMVKAKRTELLTNHLI